MDSPNSSSTSSPSDDLPSTSYDGSHLPWRAFRQDVLVPHEIRVLESPPKERIPTTFLTTVEAASQDSARFEAQKTSFWAQVALGRGFGPSPLFPPNLLPPIESEARLSRCMVPSFSREALPERVVNQLGPLYELSVAHPGLGCGFSAAAFTKKELASLPQWLHASGTVVHFDTGYISPGATMYCPFLTFERAWGNKENRVETANNQCAIAGAHCARALQMLYTRAWRGQTMPELPVSFSCTIDNSFALLNIHWIDYGQSYCMAPLCQFDLSKDVHFSKFLVWTQAIGDWALAHVLPLVKQALARLQEADVNPPPPTPVARYPVKLSLDTGTANQDELLISSLKTTFENIPWRVDHEEFTPVSSSTASWGSPMVPDFPFSSVNYPAVHPPRSNANGTANVRKRLGRVGPSPITPPPSYLQNQDMVWQKRFNHAMDEIRDLQTQLETFRADMDSYRSSKDQNALTAAAAAGPGAGSDCYPEDSTPKADALSAVPAPMLPAAPLEISASSSSTTGVGISVWKCTAIILAGHVLASFVPNTTFRLVAYGCVSNACLLAVLSPRLTMNTSLPALNFHLPSFWRLKRASDAVKRQ